MRRPTAESGPAKLVEVHAVTHAFDRPALTDVHLGAHAGEIHALLGPNGAGKTTLLRILAGLLQPQRGSVRICGCDSAREPHTVRRHIGLMPSGDGTLYPRLSALENLVFFGRLQGFRRRDAAARALEVLAEVALRDHAQKPAHAYSHGMQKRLSFARALLTHPQVLLIDEATHDLDPHAAQVVRSLATRAAAGGAAVVWTTQRLDEIRGFAQNATVLDRGAVCFHGTVAALVGRTLPTRYVLKLQNGVATGPALDAAVAAAVGAAGTIASAQHATSEDYVLALNDGHVIGDVLAGFDRAGVRILACREERSGIEDAFLTLTGGPS
jgi:ABC-2 type transport system ATP-binding protein